MFVNLTNRIKSYSHGPLPETSEEPLVYQVIPSGGIEIPPNHKVCKHQRSNLPAFKFAFNSMFAAPGNC